MTTIAETLAQAFEHHKAGRLAQAEPLYREAIRHMPGLAAVHNNLGAVLKGLGQMEAAAACYREAIRLAPDLAEAHYNLAIALQALDRHEEAVASYRETIRLKPDHVEALNNLAVALQALDQHDEATVSCREAVRLRPDYAEAHNNLAISLQHLGRLDEAAACFREAIRLQPDYAEAYCNLAAVLQKLDRPEEAAAACRKALCLKPEFAEGHFNLANALQALDQHHEAAAIYREAIRLKPDYVLAHYNLAIALQAADQHEEAAAACQEAIRLKPDYVDAYYNLALALLARDQHEEAAAACQVAIRLKPDHAEAHTVLADSLQYRGRLHEAIASYQEAVRLKSDCVDAHFNRSMAYLRLGNYEEGWIEYEWRWRRTGLFPPPWTPCGPAWDGSPLLGRTIFLYAEQGLGDTLHFIRYAPRVQALGGRVIVGCQRPLAQLFQGCAGIDQIVADGAHLPPYDLHAALMSLPRIFGTTLETIPADIPYFCADHELTKKWRRRLATFTGFKVGIVWQGNPGPWNYRLRANDRRRSFPLACFERLARLPGVTLVSLQKDFGTEQLAEVADRFSVAKLGDALHDFTDTAAVMKNLDLVISVDSSPAHLAGALGVPVWVAVPTTACWRWLLHREDSPWYPTMRLFRQKEPGNWGEVFERMACELERVVSSRVVSSQKNNS